MSAHNSAIIDGVIQHVSPSQITTHSSCKRKWFFEKKLGLRGPQTAAQERGENIHLQMENWFEKGTRPENPSARLLIDEHPIPPRETSKVLIEYPRGYALGLVAAGVPMRGRIDLVDQTIPEFPHIYDWKTTSSFNYRKSGEELAHNVQMVTYAKWAFSFFPDARFVSLSHAYVLTKGTGACVVTTDPLSREHVDSIYTKIESAVEEMKETAKAEKVDDVTPNWNECGSYGGCPFRDRCSKPIASYFDVPTSETSGTTMSITDKLAARKAAQAVQTSTLSAAPEPVPPIQPPIIVAAINPPDAALPVVKEPEVPKVGAPPPAPKPAEPAPPPPPAPEVIIHTVRPADGQIVIARLNLKMRYDGKTEQWVAEPWGVLPINMK